MIEVAEEFVEAVLGRQMLVTIAEVVLAELSGCVALGLQGIGNGRHPILNAVRISRHADSEEAGPERLLAEDERRTTGGAALLAVGVGEDRAFASDAVDVWCPISHHAHRVGADLRDANVVPKDDKDVRLSAGSRGG